jgi:hypothetical protein
LKKANFKQVTTAVGFIGTILLLVCLKYMFNIESVYLRKGILAIFLIPFLAICLSLSFFICWSWDHFIVHNSKTDFTPEALSNAALKLAETVPFSNDTIINKSEG